MLSHAHPAPGALRARAVNLYPQNWFLPVGKEKMKGEESESKRASEWGGAKECEKDTEKRRRKEGKCQKKEVSEWLRGKKKKGRKKKGRKKKEMKEGKRKSVNGKYTDEGL